MYELFNQKELKQRRRDLRNSMPDAEKKVWRLLQGKGMEGYKFRRQHGIGPYIVDFYCPKLRLAIEIDGDSHFEGDAQKKDRMREFFIRSKGIEIIRFTNIEVQQNIDTVAEVLLSFTRHLTSPRPRPNVPFGTGGPPWQGGKRECVRNDDYFLKLYVE